jgi:metal-responsive CopG/Arc/MetJ family transcriptional regulator
MPRVNIMLPEDLLNQMDRVANEVSMNRSQLVRTAVLAYFGQLAENAQHRQRQDDIQKAMDIQDNLRQSVAPWNAVKILRDQRDET